MPAPDYVLAFDLLHILTHRTIDFGDLHDLFASDSAVRAGIGANLGAVDREIDTCQKPVIYTMLDDSLEEV